METLTDINRQKGIGASEVAAVLGIDPFSQAFDIWHKKTCSPDEFAEKYAFDVAADPESLPEIGRAIEPIIADLYHRRTGKVIETAPTFVSPDYPWLFASPDRLHRDEERGLEIKNVSPRMEKHWGEEGTDDIADYYMPQVQTCMLVTGRPVWDVAAFIGGCDLRVYHVEADPEFHELIVEITGKFWRDYVQTGTPPPINYNHRTAADAVKTKHKFFIQTKTELSADVEPLIETYDFISKRASELTAAKKALLNEISDLMGTHGIGTLPSGTEVRRKEVTRESYEVEKTTYVHTTIKRPKR